MEFKLNKIDPELRQKINAITKEGKVHTKTKFEVNKDKKEKNNNEEHETSPKKNKVVVNCVKNENIEVEAFRDDGLNDNKKGRFLDITK